MEKKLFVGIIGVMLLVAGILSLFHVGNPTKLSGSYTVYEEPNFQISEWMVGNYQRDMENFISSNYAGHNFNVRLYNQFRYSVFGMSDSIVVGRNGYLYEEPYIIEALGTDEQYRLSDEEIQNIAMQIYNIQSETLRQNKAFLFVFTPSKADFVPENIPTNYYEAYSYYEEDERNYHRLIQAFDELGVIYIDGAEILQESELEVPIFYKTGTHWTRAAALYLMNEIVAELDSEYGIKLKTIHVSEYEESPITSADQDQDLYRLLNVFWAETDETYYFPVESTKKGEVYEMPNIFIQGGSFTNALSDVARDNWIFSECKREFYAISLFDYNRNVRVSTEDLNCNELNTAINQADIILLECNVENVRDLMPEIYDAIYGHLLEGMREDAVVLPIIFGVYGEENDGQIFHWAEPEILYEVKMEENWEEIIIQLELPIDTLHSLYGDDLTEKLEIYVNDRFVDAFDYSQPVLDVHLNLEELELLDKKDSIVLEIKAPYSFQPSRDFESDDTRVLAYKIRYIGGENSGF